ncbi:flagellar biosynthesis protein FlhA [Gemmobacter lanyuensis]
MTAPARVSAGDQGFKAQLGTLALPVGILCMLAMMIVPLPVALLDIFFVGNILLSLLVLMVAINSQRPLDFSSFPSLLLIGTVLRLALNVASTRVVLGEGHTGHGAAGQVIQAFGDFVIAGNFVVGFLVFAILVIINLVVLTKGAGRVSEVSARFTLDAMPGKQMAIDADLNAGLMTPDEAKARRIEVAAEADFYGSMDGASKFVKGDAVAGILILAINVIGGVLIGTLQHGLTLNEAASTYVLLAIGDGLVAQIPALLLSIATAIIVTRAAAASNMGALIGKQVNMPDAWMPVAGVLLTLGLVPGMPNLILLTAAAIAGALAGLPAASLTGRLPLPQGPRAGSPGCKGWRCRTWQGVLGWCCIAGCDHPGRSFRSRAALAPDRLWPDPAGRGWWRGAGAAHHRDPPRNLARNGVRGAGVRIRDDLTLGPNQYRIRIGQTIMGEDVVYPDRKLAIPGAGSTRKLKGVNVKDPSFGLDAVWILPHQQVEAEADDHMVIEPEAVIATHLGQVLQKHAGDLIGPDEVQALLDTLAKAAPTLVQSVVPKLVPLHVVTSVLRCLLNERVPISDMRKILEGLALVSGRTQNPQEMAEALRPALVPLLLQQLVPVTAPLPLITLEPDLEQMLMRARRPAPDEGLVIDGGLAGTMVRSLSQTLEAASGRGQRPVVIVAQALRRSFAAFLRPHLSDAVVLGIHELPEARRIEVIAAIGGPSALPGQKEG